MEGGSRACRNGVSCYGNRCAMLADDNGRAGKVGQVLWLVVWFWGR